MNSLSELADVGVGGNMGGREQLPVSSVGGTAFCSALVEPIQRRRKTYRCHDGNVMTGSWEFGKESTIKIPTPTSQHVIICTTRLLLATTCYTLLGIVYS